MRGFPLFLVVVLSYVCASYAAITVVNLITNETEVAMNDQPARYIPAQEDYFEIEGFVIAAEPEDACSPVKPPPDLTESVSWILLVKRKNCSFQTKIENAQNASYDAIIVHNVDSNATAAMGVEDSSRIRIYAVFIGEYNGIQLRDVYSYRNNTSKYYIRIEDNFSISGYIIPFTIILGISFVAMLLFMLWHQVIRWVRERRRSRKRRLPLSALKKLPTQKWSKGDPYEICAICIEDFVAHDKIRILPCSHGFHTECIDPWLTKGRRVCPICKRKVVLADERVSDSDSDSESEAAPLLGTSSSVTPPASSGGTSTFVQQRENPFLRAQRRLRASRQTRRTISESDTSSSDDSSSSDAASESNSRAPASSSTRSSVTAEVYTSEATTDPCELVTESQLRNGALEVKSWQVDNGAAAECAVDVEIITTRSSAVEVNDDAGGIPNVIVAAAEAQDLSMNSSVHSDQNSIV